MASRRQGEITNGRGENMVRRGTEEEEAWAEETTLGDEATSATVIGSPFTEIEENSLSYGPLSTAIGQSAFSEGTLRILFKDHYVGM